MTLVPIIYTSLLIFSAFLLFVIIISYVSYKVKGGKSQERHFDPYNPQPIINTVQVRKIASVPVAPRVYPQGYASIPEKNNDRVNTQYRNTEIKRGMNENKPRNTEQLARNTSLNRSSYERIARNENQNRIEIMNTSEKYHKTSYNQSAPARQNRSAQSLTDVNLLNYYSDRSDTGFVSLTAF